MLTHVRIVAVLTTLIGLVLAGGALVSFGLFGGLAALVDASGEDGAATGAFFLKLTGAALGGFLMLLGVPTLVCGAGLWRVRPWARVLGIIVAAVALVQFPWGTVFGVYALWVFFSEKSRSLFGVAGA
jgi:hypothetical protein